MASYLKKEISEWSINDLSSWLRDNKYPGISELCKNNSLSGYDLFFINDNILKNELGLNSFHERKVTMKLINKLINEHLKLNIINSNGDNVILTLDNNQETSLGELSEYIGRMFDIDPKDILYKDSTKKEVLSPTIKIVKLLILYPKLYKTLNVFNMKDYHQFEENDNENNNNAVIGNTINNNASSENESENQESNRNNMNFNYKLNRPNDINDNNNEVDEINQDNRIIYNLDYDIKKNKNKNMNYESEQRIYRRERNENFNGDNLDDIENNNNMNYGMNDKRMNNNNYPNYRIKTNYMENNENNKEYSSIRNRKNMNFNNEKPYREDYNNKMFNMENRNNHNYYNEV
jgi:hypothetical protein